MGKSMMTKCKTCGEEIAKSAETCPHCGAKNKKNSLFASIISVIIGLIIMGSIIGECGGPEKVGGDSSNQAVTKQKPQPKFGIGDRVNLHNVVVTLKSVTEKRGSAYNKPHPGNVFALCEFEIENNSSSDIVVSSFMSFTAYCDDYTAPLSIEALIEKGNKNQLDGNVAAGKKFNGIVGFEIKKDWKELEIKFTPDFWSGQSITFVAKH